MNSLCLCLVFCAVCVLVNFLGFVFCLEFAQLWFVLSFTRMSLKDEKIREAIRHAAAEFLERESNRTALITVTGVALKARGRSAVILFTVLPEEMEQGALAFLKRQRGALRGYIAKRVRMQRLPLIDCALDVGEKNRQKLDELSQNFFEKKVYE